MSVDPVWARNELDDEWWRWGYWWLGPVLIPPLVPAVGITDRVTGTVYYLLWDGNDHLVLSTTLPTPLQNNYVFPPWDGPFLGTTGVRLGISNGRVVFDVGWTESSHPLFTPNMNAPLDFVAPEPSNYPAPQPPVIPGIPSTSPVPTGGGYAAFEAAFATNQPPFVSSLSTPTMRDAWHLVFYGAE